MSIRILPAVVAVIFALAVAMLLLVPFVAREHRVRGELGIGTAALYFAALLYPLGLLAYVSLPLPPPDFCAFTHVSPQWTIVPADIEGEQFSLNILLFVPLGMFVRSLTSRGLGATALIGFGVSLAIELTQLTGTWFTYSCPYRVFDVDDLIANTFGALAGGALAPLLGRSPRRHSGAAPGAPRPVTAYRRLLGMCCDGLLLWLLGLVAAREGVTWLAWTRAWQESVALWFAPALLLLGVTVLGRGSTLGQHAVLLRSVGPEGAPGFGAILTRWTIGLGGLAITEGLVNGLALPETAATGLAVTWCTVHAFGAARGRRGITGRVAGLDVVDTRALRARTPSPT